jgi:hypothetical protein
VETRIRAAERRLSILLLPGNLFFPVHRLSANQSHKVLGRCYAIIDLCPAPQQDCLTISPML